MQWTQNLDETMSHKFTGAHIFHVFQFNDFYISFYPPPDNWRVSWGDICTWQPSNHLRFTTLIPFLRFIFVNQLIFAFSSFPFYYFCLFFLYFHFTFIVNFWILFSHSFSILSISFTYDHPMISELTTPRKDRDIQYDIYSFGNPASIGNAAMIKSKNYCSTRPFLTLTTWS